MTALLNSTAGAEYICTNYSGIIDFDIVDDDGYTARDVAELVGSDNVAKIISNFIMVHHHDSTSSKNQRWGDRITGIGTDRDIASTDTTGGGFGSGSGASNEGSRSIRDYREEEREEDYVYDVYCLDDTGNSEDKEVESRVDDGSKKQSLSGNESMLSSKSWAEEHGQREGVIFDNTGCDLSTTSDSDPVLVQMRGGVGYWNENGELVLERVKDSYDFDSDIDEDYDSNCEDNDANDYPDEDEDEDYDIPQSMMGFVRGMDEEEYSSDDNDIYTGSSDYRNHPIDLDTFATGYAMHQYGDDEDDIEDGDYTGAMYKDESLWNCERSNGKTEAFDKDYDEED